jgi:Protein of unknown function (DUF3037)
MLTASSDRRAAPVCYFSVVRYVPDPIRDEAKNIGVLVVAPDASFAGSRFNLSKLHLPAGSDRLRYLRDVVGSYQRRLPTTTVGDRDVAQREFLDTLHQEATNVIQFSAPNVALGDPRQVLEDVYRERVAEAAGGSAASFGRSDAMSAFARVFRHAGVPSEAIVPTPWIPVGRDNYVFDLGLRNGSWAGVVQILSFRKQDTLRVEQQGAWFATVYPAVHDQYSIPGHVILEAPGGGGEARRRLERVRKWSEEAGAIAHDPSELEGVAADFAKKLAPVRAARSR